MSPSPESVPMVKPEGRGDPDGGDPDRAGPERSSSPDDRADGTSGSVDAREDALAVRREESLSRGDESLPDASGEKSLPEVHGTVPALLPALAGGEVKADRGVQWNALLVFAILLALVFAAFLVNGAKERCIRELRYQELVEGSAAYRQMMMKNHADPWRKSRDESRGADMAGVDGNAAECFEVGAGSAAEAEDGRGSNEGD